jgi:hypothetical protein
MNRSHLDELDHPEGQPRPTRTSRTRSPASRRPTVVTCTSPRSPTSRVTPRSRATSATRPRARPGTRTATSTTSRRPATRRRACRSVTPPENLAASVAGETHEYTDMYPGMARRPAKRASTRSPTGSRRWPRPRSRTPASSRRCSRASPERLSVKPPAVPRGRGERFWTRHEQHLVQADAWPHLRPQRPALLGREGPRRRGHAGVRDLPRLSHVL